MNNSEEFKQECLKRWHEDCKMFADFGGNELAIAAELERNNVPKDSQHRKNLRALVWHKRQRDKKELAKRNAEKAKRQKLEAEKTVEQKPVPQSEKPKEHKQETSFVLREAPESNDTMTLSDGSIVSSNYYRMGV